MRNDLDDYFMKPYFIEGVGDIHPVNIFNYERFRELAGKYIVQGINTLHNLYKVPKNTNELDYFVENSIKMDIEISKLNEIKDCVPTNEIEKAKYNELMNLLELSKSGNIIIYSLKELEELFSLVLQKQVKFYCHLENPLDKYYFKVEDNELFVTKDNFNKLKEVVMWQNILFEPPTSPSKIGNDLIRQTIEVEFGKNEDSGNLASICSIVSVNSGVSDEQIKKYSYYRLMYDFASINRQHGNIFTFMLRSQGCNEAIITDLSQAIDLHKNPYDIIFKKHKHEQGNIK